MPDVRHLIGRELHYYPTGFPYGPLNDHVTQLSGSEPGPTTFRISTARLQRWKDHGLTSVEADRFAVRFGVTPDSLWPDLWGEEELHVSRPEAAS